MTDQRLYIENVAEVPVRQLKKFFKFIAEHDLWDEVERHLRDRGCKKLLMSFEPVKAIGNLIEQKSLQLVADHKTLPSGAAKTSGPTAMRCASNGTNKPPPNTPSDRRLKDEIIHLTTLANGVKVYSFRYIWSNQRYVGVMAQDVLRTFPHRNAVTLRHGYLRRRLRRIGTEDDFAERVERVSR